MYRLPVFEAAPKPSEVLGFIAKIKLFEDRALKFNEDLIRAKRLYLWEGLDSLLSEKMEDAQIGFDGGADDYIRGAPSPE